MKNELKISHHHLHLDGDVQKLFAVGGAGAEGSGWDSRLDWLHRFIGLEKITRLGRKPVLLLSYPRTPNPGSNLTVHACIKLVYKLRISRAPT